MSGFDDLLALSDHFGILRSFHDFNGQERITSADTMRALLAANGVDASSDAAISDRLHHLRAEADHRWFPTEVIVEAFQKNEMDFGLAAAWEVTRWGKETPVAEGQAGDFITLPALEPDVYNLRIAVAGRVEYTRVLATPPRLPQVQDRCANPRLWGISAALYGLQSDRSAGVGDFADLGALTQIAGTAGAGFVGINPVHNMGFADTVSISPYSPSHRGFYSSDHIALDAIPGLENSGAAAAVLDRFSGAFAKIKTRHLIDYTAQKPAHSACLEQLYGVFQTEANSEARAALRSYEAEIGAPLQGFARFEALSEIHGADWHRWPSDALERTAASGRDAFHVWLQWVADCQLAKAQKTAQAAGMPLGLYLDVSVGSRRNGAESWCERETIAQGISVGAPPDQLGPDGQNWNLAAYSPVKLQAAGYAPLRQILVQTMRHAGMIRIDHVLGLNRSYWIPDDGSAAAYIRQPFEALVALIKIEAWRSNTIVIGEDLGLVPDGFRDTMHRHGFYGYGVLQYEKDHDGGFRDPAQGPTQILSCFATHDTPTIRGFASARDVDWWEKLGSLSAEQAAHLREMRLWNVAALQRMSPSELSDFTSAVHQLLARASAELVCLQLDDIMGETEAQNLPGTIDEHPNWRRRYDQRLEALAKDSRLIDLAKVMAQFARVTQ